MSGWRRAAPILLVLALLLGRATGTAWAADDLLIPGQSFDPLAVPVPDASVITTEMMEGLPGLECLIVDLEDVRTGGGGPGTTGETLTMGRGLVQPLLQRLGLAANELDLDLEVGPGTARLGASTEGMVDLLDWRPVGGPLVRLSGNLVPQVGVTGSTGTANLGEIDCTLDAPLLATLGPLSAEAEVLRADWRSSGRGWVEAPLQISRWTFAPPAAQHHLQVGEAWCLDLTGRLRVDATPGQLALRSVAEAGDVAFGPHFSARPKVELKLDAAPELDWQRRLSLQIGATAAVGWTATSRLDLEYAAEGLYSVPSAEPAQRIMLRFCL